MANSLFGPSPQEVMYARQKELEDRQAAQYDAMLATATNPAERNYMMAGQMFSQALSPLLGLGPGKTDPLLMKATQTQSIISKYGADALSNPTKLSSMAQDFADLNMMDEAFKLTSLASDLRKATPETYGTFTGAQLMEADPLSYSGLYPSATYKVNRKTGDVDILNKGKWENLAKPEKGYQWEPDPTTGDPVYTLIKNSEAAKKQEQTRLSAIKATSNVVDSINKSLEWLEEGWFVTGRLGELQRSYPKVFTGSDAVNLGNAIDTIRANIGFDRLREMRNNSPTGAGVGNVTEKELGFLQNTIASLKTTNDPEVLRQNLIAVKEQYEFMLSGFPPEELAKYGFDPSLSQSHQPLIDITSSLNNPDALTAGTLDATGSDFILNRARQIRGTK